MRVDSKGTGHPSEAIKPSRTDCSDGCTWLYISVDFMPYTNVYYKPLNCALQVSELHGR